MKKLKAIVTFLFLVLIMATFSFSEENKGTLRIPIGIGVQIPFGDWSGSYDIGFNVHGGVLFPIYKRIEIQAGLGFFYNSTEGYLGSSPYKSKLTNLTLSLDGRYNIQLEGLKCFLTGGLGLYFGHVKTKITTDEPYWEVGSANKTNLAVRLGGGISITRNIEAIGMIHIIPDTNMASLGLSYEF
ncbi:MAG: outer membrane beta-barrel protein [Candidatus Marinimicrobia bacterium]|nr:outer membrane beta-barrel protein [Candidatus Neomarinimicrobiota bacterium]